jgi:hypothetical protein
MKRSPHKLKKIIEGKKSSKGIPIFIPFNNGDVDIIALAKNKQQATKIGNHFYNDLPDNMTIIDARAEIAKKFGTPIPRPFPKA